MKRKSKLFKLFLRLLFIIGFLIALFPIFSQWYYRQVADEEIIEYINVVNDIDDGIIKEKFRLAEAYNSTLAPATLTDPFSDTEKREGVREYARMLEINEKIGFIEIPKIKQNIPIYAGTSEAVLQKGAGHMEGTSLPIGGISTHSVITAHRGLPTARLFTDIDKLEIGDVFYIHVLNRIFAYKVDQILTIEPTEFSPVLIQEGKDLSTLLTCTPYMINTHRLLVRGVRIEYTEPVNEMNFISKRAGQVYFYYLMAALLFLIVLIGFVIYYRNGVRAAEKKMQEEQEKEQNKE